MCSQIPRDVWTQIFQSLPVPDVLTASLTCKLFNEISKSPGVWMYRVPYIKAMPETEDGKRWFGSLLPRHFIKGDYSGPSVLYEPNCRCIFSQDGSSLLARWQGDFEVHIEDLYAGRKEVAVIDDCNVHKAALSSNIFCYTEKKEASDRPSPKVTIALPGSLLQAETMPVDSIPTTLIINSLDGTHSSQNISLPEGSLESPNISNNMVYIKSRERLDCYSRNGGNLNSFSVCDGFIQGVAYGRLFTNKTQEGSSEEEVDILSFFTEGNATYSTIAYDLDTGQGQEFSGKFNFANENVLVTQVKDKLSVINLKDATFSSFIYFKSLAPKSLYFKDQFLFCAKLEQLCIIDTKENNYAHTIEFPEKIRDCRLFGRTLFVITSANCYSVEWT